MKNYFAFLIIALFLLNITACNNETEKYDFTGDKEYFPLKSGAQWIYNVDSIIYDNKGDIVDTVNHIVKEVITGTFVDDEGVTNYVIERYNKSRRGWDFITKWYANVHDNKAVRTEDNLKFIKMVFPVVVNKTWDGNAYFDAEDIVVKIAGEPIKMYEYWTYRYLDKDKSEDINGHQYDKVCTVQEVDYENEIQKRYSQVKYAKGIGMVYKKMIILNTQQLNKPDVPWDEKTEEGFILEQTLISYSGL